MRFDLMIRRRPLGAPIDPSPDAIGNANSSPFARFFEKDKTTSRETAEDPCECPWTKPQCHTWGERERERERERDHVSFLTRCDSLCMVHKMRCAPSLRVQLVLRCSSLLLTSLPFIKPKLSNGLTLFRGPFSDPIK